MDQTEITIVLLATTAARFGVTIAHWIADADADADADPPGPGMTLAVAGRTRPHPMEPADRVVFVVPEHQHAPAGSLYTAPPVTDTGPEARAALVSYGGLRRGIRSASCLRRALSSSGVAVVDASLALNTGELRRRGFTPFHELARALIIDSLISG